ncbi:putative ABC transport system permease protein [Amycolatopsis australiensis]|uniref:Putative ABC transport system permease protein n=2 Tax=Amycolatopsis australiensis TaxID=546364 RepID=A0A1K1SD83_9PSEU|nr:ABC transporter permease [Amycolatopsis australiensis]SFW82278.1 putative ABC transport system permease protein [Amycolatopsis australiensis]
MPWRAAPKAALSSPLTLIVAAVTALLACFLGTAAVLQASAAGGAAVTYQTGITCPDSYGPVFGKGNIPVQAIPALTGAVQRHAPAHGFGTPVVGQYTTVLTGTQFNGDPHYKIRLAYRDQAGLDNLTLQQGTRAPGLWLGNVVADAEHIGVGTRPSIRGVALPPVTGIYRDLLDPPPRWWCSQQSGAVIDRLVNDPIDSIVFATDRATFDTTITALGLPTVQNFTISFYEPPPATLSAAEDLLQRSRDLVADVRADLTAQGLGNLVAADVPTFDRSVQIARQAQDNVFVSILPLALISVLVGCAGLGTVALQWYQRRHAQLRLLSARGSGPGALGGLAVAELGLPILLGGVAGAGAARLLLGGYGPPGAPDPEAQLGALAVAAGVLAVSLALLALLVAVRAHREFELGRIRRTGRRMRLLGYFPWELLTAGMAWLGWTRLARYGTASRLGNPLPQVDPLALTYPVFVVLTVGLLTARLAWLALHASHRARLWSHPALQLAIRRLAGARAPVTGVLVIGTLAIGTLATGIGIARGQEEALDTKSAIFVGSNARLDTDSPIGMGQVAMPAALAGTSTVVGELTGTGSVVLVVDPATFTQGAAVADVPADDLAGLLHRISQPDPRGTPVLRIGHTAKQSARLPGGLRDAVPVADLPVFPMIGTSPGYVVSRTALDHDQLDRIPKWSVLTTAPLADATAALRAAGVYIPNRISRETALDGLPFFVVSWTFSFVALLGAVLGVVAVLALLVAVEVRRRQNALAGALVLRMGMRPRALLASHLMELGALSGLAIVVGVACGLSVAGLSVPRFDPATFLAPRSELPDPLPFVLTVLAIGALVVALAGWIAVRSVRTARTAELIRA